MTFFYYFFFFLLLNSVYTVLPLSQGLDRVKGGTIHMKTVKYVHTKLCLSVYTHAKCERIRKRSKAPAT